MNDYIIVVCGCSDWNGKTEIISRLTYSTYTLNPEIILIKHVGTRSKDVTHKASG